MNNNRYKVIVAIYKTLQILKKKRIQLNINSIPLNDPKSYEIMLCGNTFGVFQVEGKDISKVVSKISPVRFEHLVASLALCYPGPFILFNDYMARKTGKVKIHYDHLLLKPILNETYGITLGQNNF